MAGHTVGRFFLAVGVGIFLFVSWRRFYASPGQPSNSEAILSQGSDHQKGMDVPISANGDYWKTVDVFEKQIPGSILEAAPKVVVKLSTASVMGKDIFYLEAEGSSLPPVLLLHGAAFSSKTWLELGTIRFLAAAGHRVVAVDLPGYGKSSGTSFRGDKGGFLSTLLKTLGLCESRAVIVSPSMSGGFSLPFLAARSPTCPMGGFVGVAPVGTNALDLEKLRMVDTPALVVYGSRDVGLGTRSKEVLGQMPNARVVELPDASHPAYLDQPEKWHQLLYNFLLHVKEQPK